jgi:hypothetical protein
MKNIKPNTNFSSRLIPKGTLHAFVKIIFGFVFFLVSFLNFSLAQIAPGEFSIIFEPRNPSVGEVFEISLETYAFDVDKSDITFSSDEKILSSGFGKKNINFTMLENTKIMKIIITTPEGKSYLKTINISPKSVYLISEGLDSYVPDWYEGKKLLSPAGKARVYTVANILDGKNNLIDKKDLLYTWEMNDEILQKESGLGRDYIDVQTFDEQGGEINIKVTVSPRLSDEKIESSIVLNPTKSQVFLYKEIDAFNTSFQNVLSGNYKLNQKDFVVVAEPFFFSTNKTSNLVYNWTVNNQLQKGSFKKGFKIGSASGLASISLQVEHVKKLFQEAATGVNISF